MKKHSLKILFIITIINLIHADIKKENQNILVPVHIFAVETDPDANHAITGTCLKNLGMHDPAHRAHHILISYEIVKNLKKLYKKAKRYFNQKGITEPHKQIIVQALHALSATNPYAIPHCHNLITHINIAAYENPDLLLQQNIKLTKKNCKEHEFKIDFNGGEFVEHFELILAFLADWQWYDTHLGVYYVTQPTIDHSPFNIGNFTTIEPLKTRSKKKSAAWINNLPKIFNTTNQSYRWSFYVMGHGSGPQHYKKEIFGLPYCDAAQLLEFFNRSLKTDIITFLSCYSPAERILTLAQEYDLLPLKFPFISSGTQHTEQYSSGLDILYYEPAWYHENGPFCFTQTFTGPGLDDRLTTIHKKIIKDNQNPSFDYKKTLAYIKNNPWNENLEPSFLAQNSSQQVPIVLSQKFKRS